jgi:hypothetical protein
MQIQSQDTVIAAATLVELITRIVSHVSDETFTDMLSGSVVTRDTLATMVGSSISRQLSHQSVVSTQA